ncbi:alcohol dehydrogenase [Eremomyces bilateralis CBS 781.70]|uniref:Alcohol dehydrogenase n=1 Tax=Eremomyces bilateralis CBS 781.70 TaxID=1392243 RepID=A0A6G1GGB1_9PEZI|nr:alcohol dehydrogenase [Eremomyces bilateralis CBS 781.70]KAF1817032.1 alcohol dehydrogenase [Eremomyces bilateralis CBS 781.70]
MAPKSMKQWSLPDFNGFDSLKLEEVPVPECGDDQVLVRLTAASLNYRDLIISKAKYPFPTNPGVVPGSDGAGVVEAVGKRVRLFKPGDRVVTLFNQRHLAGRLTDDMIYNGSLGGNADGTLREYGVFSEHGVLKTPSNLSDVEASTLTCAGVTAWNALFGMKDRAIKPGDTVLTQGTGGVSLFAVQFAKAAGATVIATTSSEEKAQRLRKLGADHILNYKENPNWGEAAKNLTPNKVGVDHVIEVAGPKSMEQSLAAVRIEGVITIIGFLGGVVAQNEPGFLNALTHQCTIRGLLVGSRLQFEDMNAAVESQNIKPIVDERIFKFDQLKEAYQHMWDQKHFGKVVVKFD